MVKLFADYGVMGVEEGRGGGRGGRYCKSETWNNNYTLSGMVHLLHQWHQLVRQNTSPWIVNNHFTFKLKLLYKKRSQICNALSSRILALRSRKQSVPKKYPEESRITNSPEAGD